jgi:hypothetical protein
MGKSAQVVDVKGVGNLHCVQRVRKWMKRRGCWKEIRSNRAKHGVSFEAATLVFDDPHAVGVPDLTEEGEERWKTVGMAAGVVPLLVVHTHRE